MKEETPAKGPVQLGTKSPEPDLASKPSGARATLSALRPKQWVKNLLLFAGLVFSGRLADLRSVAIATLAFAIFTALSGAGYLLNDLLDIERDRTHPRKARRPLTAGSISTSRTLWLAGALTLAALGGSAAINLPFLALAAGYVVLALLYSTLLKHVFLVDVISLALFYVLRAAAGAAAIHVPASPWLLVCTVLLALFLGLCKRRQELVTLGRNATDHRAVLRSYSVALVDRMVVVIIAATLITYVLYTFFSDHGRRNALMILTFPFVIFGLFRYLYLAYRRSEPGAPEDILLRDGPLLTCVALWVIAVSLILYVPIR